MKTNEFWQNTKKLNNMAMYGDNNKMKKGCKEKGGGGLLYLSKAPNPSQITYIYSYIN